MYKLAALVGSMAIPAEFSLQNRDIRVQVVKGRRMLVNMSTTPPSVSKL